MMGAGAVEAAEARAAAKRWRWTHDSDPGKLCAGNSKQDLLLGRRLVPAMSPPSAITVRSRRLGLCMWLREMALRR